jgi:hypothetical protein
MSLPMDHGFCVVQAPLPTHNKHVPITTHKINVENNNILQCKNSTHLWVSKLNKNFMNLPNKNV